MPNLLAHVGIQGFALRACTRRADAVWVLTGAVLPDVPWILQRALRSLLPTLDPYELRAYAIAQASLACALIGCAALAALSLSAKRAMAVSSASALSHLLLDALERKWANGVLLGAPLDWTLVQFGTVWPEHALVTAASLMGVAYLLLRWFDGTPLAKPLPLRPRRLLAALTLGIGYLGLPLAWRDEVERRNHHFIATLRDRAERAGRYVEFDRQPYIRVEDRGVLTTLAGERLTLVGAVPPRSGTVSVRGAFVSADTVYAFDWHAHSSFRNAASYAALLGLVALACRGPLRRLSHASLQPGPRHFPCNRHPS